MCLRNSASAGGSRDRSSRAEVLGHEPVVAGEARGAGRARAAGLHRERREVQPRRPALRPVGQLGELARHPARPRPRPGAGSASRSSRRSSAHADLLQVAVRPPAGDRQRRLLAARDRELRTGRHVPEQRGQHVEADGIRRSACRSSSTSTKGCSSAASARPRRGTRFGPGRSPGPDRASKHIGGQRLDPVDRGGDVPQEHQGVVVAAVERHPRERPRIGLGPAGQERRLAVAGGRDDRSRAGSPPPHSRAMTSLFATVPRRIGGGASFASERSKEASAVVIAARC